MNRLLALSPDCRIEFAKGSRAFGAQPHRQLFDLLDYSNSDRRQTKSSQPKQTIPTDHAMFIAQLGVLPRLAKTTRVLELFCADPLLAQRLRVMHPRLTTDRLDSLTHERNT